MSKRKFVLLILIIIALLLSAFAFLIFRNGTQISAEGKENIAYPITSFRQDDARWHSDALGNSDYTMEKSGCITTCIASAVSCGLDEVTPGDLNKIFSENSVYDAEGNLEWQKLENIGYRADVLPSVSSDEIYNYLKNCQFPILRVRVNGFGSFHYVLVVGIENGEYICMDPLKDSLTPLSDYWNRVYAVRVVY